MENVFFILPVVLVLNVEAMLNSNDCKRMQSIHSIETDIYWRNKDQWNEYHKLIQTWLNFMMLQKKT